MMAGREVLCRLLRTTNRFRTDCAVRDNLPSEHNRSNMLKMEVTLRDKSTPVKSPYCSFRTVASKILIRNVTVDDLYSISRFLYYELNFVC